MNCDVSAKGTQRNNLLAILGIDQDETLELARQMDLKALAQIHDRYYPEVYRYTRYRLEDEHICEDIASEVFLRLLDALRKQRGPNQNLRGWLMGTASNLVNDHLRQRYSRPVDPLDEKQGLLSNHISPESAVENSWQQEHIRTAIRKLTAEQQHVLALRFADERSMDETAKIIGKSVTAVKALQFRALTSLRRLLSIEERA